MSRGNLPHKAYPSLPLVWGAPPTGNDASDLSASVIAPPTVNPIGAANGNLPSGAKDLSAALTPVTFGFRYNNGSITAAFPNAVRVMSQTFVTAIGLVAVELSTSIINASSDGVIGIFVCKDQGNIIDVSQATQLLVSHLVEQGLSHSMRSGTTFADDVAPKFGTAEKIAVYACAAGTNSGNDVFTALVTIRYFQLTL